MLTDDGVILGDGHDMIGYLDGKLLEAQAKGKLVTGILISSDLRVELTKACQAIMGQKTQKLEETVNKYRGALIIEDGEHENRLEVISGGKGVIPPVEDFSLGRTTLPSLRKLR